MQRSFVWCEIMNCEWNVNQENAKWLILWADFMNESLTGGGGTSKSTLLSFRGSWLVILWIKLKIKEILWEVLRKSKRHSVQLNCSLFTNKLELSEWLQGLSRIIVAWYKRMYESIIRMKQDCTSLEVCVGLFTFEKWFCFEDYCNFVSYQNFPSGDGFFGLILI